MRQSPFFHRLRARCVHAMPCGLAMVAGLALIPALIGVSLLVEDSASLAPRDVTQAQPAMALTRTPG